MIRSGLLALAGLIVLASPARATCSLGQIADLPVTMVGMQPLIPSKINGVDVMFVADSGAFYSMISPGNAAELHLRTGNMPGGLRLTGVGGDVEASVATVKTFTLAKTDIHNVEFIVGGSEVSNAAVGLIGQNVLRVADVEYDLANGALRLMKPHGCEHAELAYWATGKPYSVMDISWGDALHPHTEGTALLNGRRIRVMFDTGAANSVLSLHGARLGGIKTDGPGVEPAGLSGGIGRNTVQTWLAPVTSLELGDERITNSKLRIGDIGADTDMLIGADFFLSHRVYVSNSQHKLYFSYNGGPVFNLAYAKASPSAPDTDPAKTAGSPDTKAASAGPGGAPPAEPKDADGLARRGAAFAARHDYQRALADLTRASDLAPNEPRYLQQRALVRISLGQLFLAMSDLDAALKLKPDDVQARMARAGLRLAGHDLAGGREDLDAVAQASAKPADIRFELAELHSQADLFEPAIDQFSEWIDAHPDDSRRAMAMNGRCWARALANRELDKALADCNTAVRLAPREANPLDSRGLIRLRRGEFARAIADYDAALALSPKIPWSLFGRGLAELNLGEAAAGEADIAAANALAPKLLARATKFKLTPPTHAVAAVAPAKT